MSRVRISKEEAEQGFQARLVDFDSGIYDDQVTRSAVDLASQGEIRGYLIPAVSVVIDAALDTLQLPSVQERLENEVDERRYTAQYIAEYATTTAYRWDAFLNFVAKNRHFKESPPSQSVLGAFEDQRYMLSLVTAPFYDVTRVAGGALNLLRDEGITCGFSEIIARSTGLLALSGVYKLNAGDVEDYLGDPYTDTDHLDIGEIASGTVVVFTPFAKDFLKTMQKEGQGCPAANVCVGDSGQALLASRWDKIVNYLVTDNATADSRKRVIDLQTHI